MLIIGDEIDDPVSFDLDPGALEMERALEIALVAPLVGDLFGVCGSLLC